MRRRNGNNKNNKIQAVLAIIMNINLIVRGITWRLLNKDFCLDNQIKIGQDFWRIDIKKLPRKFTRIRK